MCLQLKKLRKKFACQDIGGSDVQDVKKSLAQKKKLLDAEKRNKTLACKLAAVQKEVDTTNEGMVE